jgi:hypothetical protein
MPPAMPGEPPRRDAVLWEGHVAHSVYLGKYLQVVLLSLVPAALATAYWVLVLPDARRWEVLVAGWLLTLLGGALAFAWRWLSTLRDRWLITERRVEHSTGVLTRKVTSLDLWRVRDVTYEQTVGDLIFRRARYTVYSSDASDPTLLILGLPPDRDLHQRFLDAVEAARRAQRVVAVDG